MNATLRIQIRVQAAQALAQLKVLSGELARLAAGSSGASGRSAGEQRALRMGGVDLSALRTAAALQGQVAKSAVVAARAVNSLTGGGRRRSTITDAQRNDARGRLYDLKVLRTQEKQEQAEAARSAAAQLKAANALAKAKERATRSVQNNQGRAYLYDLKTQRTRDKAVASAAAAAAKEQQRALAEAERAQKRMQQDLDAGQGKMLRWGKSIQSAGRQLTYNFTYPLVRAGRAVFGFQQDNERAMTQLQKVYGTAGDSAKQFAKDQGPLRAIFRDLSDKFGINLAEVTNLAAEWAAAGATGVSLARSVQVTVEAMNLFDFTSADEAVNSLISIQTAFKLTAGQLQTALYTLNAVENETAVTGADLVAAFVRVGSVAQASGVSIKELAADVAALVPTTGSAETAGNGLKTMFSRLMSPTAAAKKTLHEIGIEFQAWQESGSTAQQRLMDIAVAFKDATDTQKVYIATQIFGRYQANRGVELLTQLIDKNSVYSKALKASTSDTKAMTLAQAEINVKLLSTPQQFAILSNRMKNMMIDVITPMIPLLLRVVKVVVAMLGWFNKLPSSMKGLVVMAAVVLAVIGPIARLTGAFAELIGITAKFARLIGLLGPSTNSLLIASNQALAASNIELAASYEVASTAAATFAVDSAGVATIVTEAAAAESVAAAGTLAASLAAIAVPALIVAGIALLIVAIIKYRHQIGAFFTWLARGFWGMVTAVGRALAALYGVVERFVKRIWHWLSYLNPFAHHSPSLVEQADAGIDRIMKAYGRLSGLGTILRSASQEITKFNGALGDVLAEGKLQERDTQRDQIVAAAKAPFARPVQEVPYGSYNIPLDRPYTIGPDYKSLAKGSADAAERHIAKMRADEEKARGIAERKAVAVITDEVDAVYDKIDELQGQADILTDEYAKQSDVVNQLSVSLDAAQKAYDRENDVLTKMQTKLDSISDALSAAKDKLDSFVNAPLKGMKDMDDKIFANEMAQKKLRLEILRIEEVTGPLEDVKSKLAAIGAEIDKLRSTEAELRQGGAGSEITGVYDERIASLQAAADSLKAGIDPIQKLQDELDRLGTKAEELDLERSLQFDPLTRQLQGMVDTSKELTFDEAKAGIEKYKPIVEGLTTAYDLQKTQVDNQKASVDLLKGSLDAIQGSYDIAKGKLDDLSDAYDKVTGAIVLLEAVLQAVAKIGADQLAEGADFSSSMLGNGAVSPEDQMQKIFDELDKRINGDSGGGGRSPAESVGAFLKKWLWDYRIPNPFSSSEGIGGALLGGPGNSLPGLKPKSSTAQSVGSTGSNVIINGNLNFPNITKPDEAEKFISNLEALTGPR